MKRPIVMILTGFAISSINAAAPSSAEAASSMPGACSTQPIGACPVTDAALYRVHGTQGTDFAEAADGRLTVIVQFQGNSLFAATSGTAREAMDNWWADIGFAMIAANIRASF